MNEQLKMRNIMLSMCRKYKVIHIDFSSQIAFALKMLPNGLYFIVPPNQTLWTDCLSLLIITVMTQLSSCPKYKASVSVQCFCFQHSAKCLTCLWAGNYNKVR